MKKAARSVPWSPLVLSALLSARCATVLQDRTQFIPVTSSPAFATVSVNGQRRGATPFYLTLARNEKNQVIRIESPGYNPVEIRVKRNAKAGYVLADVLAGAAVGGLIAVLPAVSGDEVSSSPFVKYGALSAAAFILIDLAVGKGYTLEPKELVVRLQKADGTPRVDAILISADDLLNIHWIRVHGDRTPAGPASPGPGAIGRPIGPKGGI